MDSEVFAESFLAGREFTALVLGAPEGSDEPICMPVVERVFDVSLPESQRFLAFNRYWAGYGGGQTQASTGTILLYSYALAPPEAQENLMSVARAAFKACDGRSYGRVDIRTRTAGDIECATACVLEVNSQPGFSFERNTSSMAEILYLSGVEPIEFMRTII